MKGFSGQKMPSKVFLKSGFSGNTKTKKQKKYKKMSGDLK